MAKERDNMQKKCQIQGLMPCPFCGGVGELKKTAFGRPVMRWIRCSACGASSSAYSSQESAVAAWQNRFEKNEVKNAESQTATH